MNVRKLQDVFPLLYTMNNEAHYRVVLQIFNLLYNMEKIFCSSYLVHIIHIVYVQYKNVFYEDLIDDTRAGKLEESLKRSTI